MDVEQFNRHILYKRVFDIQRFFLTDNVEELEVMWIESQYRELLVRAAK